MRKLIAGFASSIDGFIKGPKGEIDWIIYDKEVFKELEKQWSETDAMFHGRVTYEEVINMYGNKGSNQSNPFAHMKHYVFSNTLTSVEEGFILINGDLEKEVRNIKNEPGKNIVVFGGAKLLSSLLAYKLVDEIVLAISPSVLGNGIPFFTGIESRIDFTLKECKSYSSGLVHLTYTLKKSKK
jgi:dihydrofolate reductase